MMPSISDARDWLPPERSRATSRTGRSTQRITMSHMSWGSESPKSSK
ncbi:Uncharacterised protein [Bordetella pertussis]|nr:Uncharacterised protein [Bordetella pertussis]